MSQHESGFALITVLLMVSVMVLLTLSEWKNILVYQRSIAQLAKQQDALIALETVSRLVRQDHAAPVEGKREWHDHEVGYRLAEKGVFPCMRREVAGTTWSTAHIEIETWLVDSPKQRLVVRFAQLVPLRPCLAEQVHWVTSEVLSWQLM